MVFNPPTWFSMVLMVFRYFHPPIKPSPSFNLPNSFLLICLGRVVVAADEELQEVQNIWVHFVETSPVSPNVTTLRGPIKEKKHGKNTWEVHQLIFCWDSFDEWFPYVFLIFLCKWLVTILRKNLFDFRINIQSMTKLVSCSNHWTNVLCCLRFDSG